MLKKIDRNQTIELETNVFNQHNQQVISGTSKVKVLDKKKNTKLPKVIDRIEITKA